MVGNSYNSYAGSTNAAVETRCNGNKCSGKMKPINFLSQKQKLELKKWIADPRKGKFDPNISRVIVCVGCTPGPQFEFYCHGCDTVKDRGKFSKAQLRNPDNAHCWPCMEKRANTEPDGGESDFSDVSGSSGGGSYEEDSDDAATTSGGTMAGLSLTGSGGGNSSSGYQTSLTGGVQVPSTSTSGITSYKAAAQRGASGVTPSYSGTSSGGGAGVHSGLASPRGIATPPHLHAKQMPSYSNGSSSVNGSYAESTATERSTSNRAFAKVPAGNKTIVYGAAQKQRDEEAAARAAQAKGRMQTFEDDDDDDVRAVSDSDSD